VSRLTTGAGARTALVGLLAGVLTFAGGFAAARALSGGDDGGGTAAKPVQQVPEQLVTVNNLERAPSIKPLRSVAGGP